MPKKNSKNTLLYTNKIHSLRHCIAGLGKIVITIIIITIALGEIEFNSFLALSLPFSTSFQ